jgi:hypothetical protein
MENAALEDAESAIDEIESEIFERHAETTAALELRRAALEALADERVAELRRLVDERMVDLRGLADERFAELAQQGEQLATDVNAHTAEIEQDLLAAAPDAMYPTTDEFQWPEPADGWDDPLFDSTRDYVSQVDRFKAHQGKPTARDVQTSRFSSVCQICGTAFESKRRGAKFCSVSCRNAQERNRYHAKR